MNKEEENALVSRAQNGDKLAFEDLVLYYRPHATRFANSLLNDSWAAEDIAQECFAKVWLNLLTFKIGTSFKSWLFTIIRNRCIDYCRTQKINFELPEEWDMAGGKEPENVLAQKETWNEFIQSFKKQAPDAQMALYLFAAEEMTYNEIARVMGKNSVQIKTLIYRTRKKMKQERNSMYDR